jgi:predicted nucleic acid-binding protein
MGYLVDSNVLIDYVAERFKKHQLKALDLIFDESLTISIITKIEILGFNGVPDEEIRMIDFLGYSDIIMLTEAIVGRTILLKKSIKIKTPEAIIASTALVHDLTLITNNIADFKRVEGLKTFNPYEV